MMTSVADVPTDKSPTTVVVSDLKHLANVATVPAPAADVPVPDVIALAVATDGIAAVGVPNAVAENVSVART